MAKKEEETIHYWKWEELAKRWCSLLMSNDINKTYKRSCIPTEEWNQPGHLPGLISLPRMLNGKLQIEGLLRRVFCYK